MELLKTTLAKSTEKLPQLLKVGGVSLFHYVLFVILGGIFLSSLCFIPYAWMPIRFSRIWMAVENEHVWLVLLMAALIVLFFYLPLFFFSVVLTRQSTLTEHLSPYRLPIKNISLLTVWLLLTWGGLLAPIVLLFPDNPALVMIWAALVLVVSLPLTTHFAVLVLPPLAVRCSDFAGLFRGHLSALKQANSKEVGQLFSITCLFGLITAGLGGGLFYSLHQGYAVGSLFVGLVLVGWLFSAIPILSLAGLQVNHVILYPQPWQDSPRSYLWYLTLAAILGAGIHAGQGDYNQFLLIQLTDQVQEQIQVQQKYQIFSRPILRGSPLPGDGAPAYWQLIGRHKTDIPGESKRNYVMPTPDLDVLREFEDDKHLYQPLPTLNKKYASLIQQLRLAGQHNQITFAVDFSIASMLPDLTFCQDLTRLMLSTAIEQCQQARCAEGAQLLMDTLRFNQDLGHQGLLLPYLIALGNQTKAVRAFGPYFYQGQFTPAELHTLLAELRQLLLADQGHFRQVVRHELVALQNTALLMNQPDLFLREIATGEDDYLFETMVSRWVKQHLITPYIIDALHKLAQLNVLLEPMLTKPYAQSRLQQNRVYVQLDEWEQQGNPVLLTLMPAIQGPFERQIKNQVLLTGLYVHLALQGWLRQHGNVPEQLQQLVPEWLPELPLDAYSGQPFRYQRTSPQHYRLYSVGENLRDDGGNGHYQAPCATLDMVFTSEKLHPEMCHP